MAAAGTTSPGRHRGVGRTWEGRHQTVPLNPACHREGGCLPLPGPGVSQVKWLSEATVLRGFWEELHKHHR